MQFVYSLINFLLLAGLIIILGRKQIVAIFRTRRERINRELDTAEADVPAPVLPSLPTGEIPETEEMLVLRRSVTDAKASAAAFARRQKTEYARDCDDMRRAMLSDARTQYVSSVLSRVRELVAAEPLRSILRGKEAGMVDRVLERVQLTNGDMAYLLKSGVLYVTLSCMYPMEDALATRMEERMERILADVGGKPSFRVKVNEDLLGGFQLRVGDTVYDCSVENRMYRLSRALTRQPVVSQDGDGLLAELMDALEKENDGVDVYQVGRVISVSDGICWLDGLSDIVFGGVVEFACGERGMVLDIERDRIACAIFGRYEHIESYSRVRRLGVIASVPVGEELLGRVVDALGRPIDGKGRIWSHTRRPIEFGAPPIPDRKSVFSPLHTGVKIIDALVPIGRGQRELIIGDRQTGKTSIAVDAIISQKGKNTSCVYVAIGQKETAVAEIVSKLEKFGAMAYTTVVCAPASDSASLQYVAPFSGAAMCEYFMAGGRNTLIVYDDLSKHAVAYRELSLLLHKPSGREAYPGDIFYLHARLLERAAQLSDEAGGGSMTALPIIETQAGDISAYIPTNVISITDGQIFLETDLFNEGQRPAVNVGLSVSRVGSAAQTRLMKQVSSQLRMRLAQYRELQNFAQFGADLDDATRRVLAAGARMMAALRQARYAPLPDWKQALLIYAVAEGYAECVAPEDMERYEMVLYACFETQYPKLVTLLDTGNKLDAAATQALRQALAAVAEGM